MIYGNYKQLKFWMAGDVDERVLFNLLQIIPLIIIVKNINIEWLKIWLAPKIWLIEYASNILK